MRTRAQIAILLLVFLAGCTRGGHIYLGNSPLCPNRGSGFDSAADYLKGATVCYNTRLYMAKKDHPPVGPPNKEWWKVY